MKPITCAALVAALLSGPAAGYPELWFGVRASAPAPTAAWRFVVNGDVRDLSSGGMEVRMGANVLITGVMDNAGPTVCGSGVRCRITAPLRSPRWVVWPDGRMTVTQDATVPEGGSITIVASDARVPGAGAGMVSVMGVLHMSGASVSVIGTPKYLPLPLITAYAVPDLPSPGDIPPGTALELRVGAGLSILYLIEAP